MKEESILLKDLQELLKNKKKFKVSEAPGHIGVSNVGNGDGSQGEYNETFIFYRHPGFPEGIFMRETNHTDSYGYDEALVEINFVKGKEKTITIYEPI